MSSNSNIIALTMGDPSGVGTEIAIRAKIKKIKKPDFFIIHDIDFVKKIISYEPFPDLFNIAKINLASVKNIKQNNYGWAKKKGNYTFYENISNYGVLSLIKNK